MSKLWRPYTMIVRLILAATICMALTGCVGTNYAPEGDSARAQLDPDFPRGR